MHQQYYCLGESAHGREKVVFVAVGKEETEEEDEGCVWCDRCRRRAAPGVPVLSADTVAVCRDCVTELFERATRPTSCPDPTRDPLVVAPGHGLGSP